MVFHMYVVRVRWPTYQSTLLSPFFPVILGKKKTCNTGVLSFLGLYISPQWYDLHAQKRTILAGLSLFTTPSSEESLLQIHSSRWHIISNFCLHFSSFLISCILHFLSSQVCYWIPKTKQGVSAPSFMMWDKSTQLGWRTVCSWVTSLTLWWGSSSLLGNSFHSYQM